MNKRLISRLMHERISGIKSSGVYFFRGNFDQVLRGIVLEYVPRGMYIWDFRFPLFDLAGPNLLYSNRMPERPFIANGEMSEQEVVNAVLASAEAKDALGTNVSMGMDEFIRYINESDCLLNAHARLIYVAALALLDDESRARDMLDEILPVLHPSDRTDGNRLRESLEQGRGATRALLEEVRQANLKTLGLT